MRIEVVPADGMNPPAFFKASALTRVRVCGAGGPLAAPLEARRSHFFNARQSTELFGQFVWVGDRRMARITIGINILLMFGQEQDQTDIHKGNEKP
jgi:hypothetical protein